MVHDRKHTHTHTHTYSKASWLLTGGELLWRVEYYPPGTSFTSSIFTEFLCVLLLPIIRANCTHTLLSPYHTLFYVRECCQSGAGESDLFPPLSFTLAFVVAFWIHLVRGFHIQLFLNRLNI